MAESQEFITRIKGSTKVVSEEHEMFSPHQKGVHLFVMVHGFQGNHNDLRLLRNMIQSQFPNS